MFLTVRFDILPTDDVDARRVSGCVPLCVPFFLTPPPPPQTSQFVTLPVPVLYLYFSMILIVHFASLNLEAILVSVADT